MRFRLIAPQHGAYEFEIDPDDCIQVFWRGMQSEPTQVGSLPPDLLARTILGELARKASRH